MVFEPAVIENEIEFPVIIDYDNIKSPDNMKSTIQGRLYQYLRKKYNTISNTFYPSGMVQITEDITIIGPSWCNGKVIGVSYHANIGNMNNGYELWTESSINNISVLTLGIYNGTSEEYISVTPFVFD